MAEITNNKASSPPIRIAWGHHNKPSSDTRQKEETNEQFDSFSRINPEASILRLPNIRALQADTAFTPNCSFDIHILTDKSIAENIDAMKALVEAMDDNDRASLLEGFTGKGFNNLSFNETILAKEIIRHRLLRFRQKGYDLETVKGPEFNTVFFDKRKDAFLLDIQSYAKDKKLELPVYTAPRTETNNPLLLPKPDPFNFLKPAYEYRIDLAPAYHAKAKDILKSINIDENDPNYQTLYSGLVKHLEYQRDLMYFDNGQLDRTTIPRHLIENNPRLKEIFNEHAAYFTLVAQFNSVSERLHELCETYRGKNLYADCKWYSPGIENVPFGLLHTLFLQEMNNKEIKRVSPEDKFRTLVLIEKFKKENPEIFADGNGILSFVHSYNKKSDESIESTPYTDNIHSRVKKEPAFIKYTNELLIDPMKYLKGSSTDPLINYESLTEDEKEIVDTHQTRYNIKLFERKVRTSLVEQCDECFDSVRKTANQTLNGEGWLDIMTDSLRRLTYRDATSTDISNKLKEVREAKNKLDELKYSLAVTKDGHKIDTVEGFTEQYNDRVKGLIKKLEELQGLLGEHEEARQLWNEVITDVCAGLAACTLAPLTGGGSLVMLGTAFAAGGATKVILKSSNDFHSDRGFADSKSYARDLVTGGITGVTCLTGVRIEQMAARALMKQTGWGVGKSLLGREGLKYLGGRIPLSMASGAGMGFSVSLATEAYDSLTIETYRPSFEEIMGNGYRAAGLGAILNPIFQGASYSLGRAFAHKPPKLDPNLPELARTNPKAAEKQINSYLRYLARVNNIDKKLTPKVQITDDVENAMGIYTNKGHLIKLRPEFADANIISHEYFHNVRALLTTQARLQVPDAAAQSRLNLSSNYKTELINSIVDQIGTEEQIFNPLVGVHQRPNFSRIIVPKIRQLVRDSLDTYEFNTSDKSFNINARKYNEILDKFIDGLTNDELEGLLKNLNSSESGGTPKVTARIRLDEYLTVERGRFHTLDSKMQIYPGDKNIYDPSNKKFMNALLSKPFNNRHTTLFRQSIRYHAESINVPQLHTLSLESDIARQFSLFEEIRARNHGYSKKLSGLLKENPELETSLRELSSEVPKFEENFPKFLKEIKEQVNAPGNNPEIVRLQSILKQIENPKAQEAIKLKSLMKYNSQLYQAQGLIHKFKEINCNGNLTPLQRDSIQSSLMNRIKDTANKAQKYRWTTKNEYGQYIDEGIAFNEILEFLADPANRIASTALNPPARSTQPNERMAYRFTPDNDANLPNVKDFSLDAPENPLLSEPDLPLNTIQDIEQALKGHSEIYGLLDEYVSACKFDDVMPGPLGSAPRVLLSKPEPLFFLEEINARAGYLRLCQNYIKNCDPETLSTLIKDLRKSIDGTWKLYLNKREGFLESKFLNKRGTEKLGQAADNAFELHNRLIQIAEMIERFRDISIYQYHTNSIPELTEVIRQKALGRSYNNPINEYLKKVNEFCNPAKTGTYKHNIENEDFAKTTRTYSIGRVRNNVTSHEIAGNKWVVREVSESPLKDFPPKPTNIYRINAAPSEELITAMDQFIIRNGGTYRVASSKESWLTNHDTVVYYPHFKLSLEAEVELAKITSKFARPSGTSFGGEKITDALGNEINPWLKKDSLPTHLQQFQLVQQAYDLDSALGEALNLKWRQTNGFGPTEFRAIEEYLTGLENSGFSITQFSLHSPAAFVRRGMPNTQPLLNPELVNTRNHAMAERQLKLYFEYLARRSGRNPKLNPKAEILDPSASPTLEDFGAYVKNQNKIVSNRLWYEVLAHEDKHFEFAYHLTHLRLHAPEEFKKALIKHMVSSFENRNTMIDFDSLQPMRRLHFPTKVSSKAKSLLNDCLELFNLPKDKADPTINTSKVIEKIENFTNSLTVDERDILLLHFSRIGSIDQIISDIAKTHNVSGVNCFLDVFRSNPNVQNIFINDLINAHITLELKRFTGFCIYGLPCPQGQFLFHPCNKHYVDKILNTPYPKGDYVIGNRAIGQLIEIYDVPNLSHASFNKNLISTQIPWTNYLLLYEEIYARIKGYSEEAKGILRTNPQLEKVVNNTRIQNGQAEAFLNTLQDIKGGTDFIKAITKVKYNSRLFRAKFLKEEIIKANKNPQDQGKIPDLMSALQEAIDEAEKCRWPYKISATEYTGEGAALDAIRRFLQRLVTSPTQ